MIKLLEKIFIFLAVVPLVGVLVYPPDFRLIGDLGWYLLLAIMALHPLVNIFPNVVFLKKLMPLRKSAGILCGSLLFFHVVAFFVSSIGLTLESFLSAMIWDYKGIYFWGMIGVLIIILLTLTSNLWSVIHLKKWWKRLHYLTYVAFILGAVHVVLVILYRENWEWNRYMLTTAIPIAVVVFLRILSFVGFKISPKVTLPANNGTVPSN